MLRPPQDVASCSAEAPSILAWVSCLEGRGHGGVSGARRNSSSFRSESLLFKDPNSERRRCGETGVWGGEVPVPGCSDKNRHRETHLPWQRRLGWSWGQTSERQGRAGPLPVRVSRPFRAQRAGRFRARRRAAAPLPRGPGRQRTDGAGTRTFAHGADAEAEMNQEMKVSNL